MLAIASTITPGHRPIASSSPQPPCYGVEWDISDVVNTCEYYATRSWYIVMYHDQAELSKKLSPFEPFCIAPFCIEPFCPAEGTVPWNNGGHLKGIGSEYLRSPNLQRCPCNTRASGVGLRKRKVGPHKISWDFAGKAPQKRSRAVHFPHLDMKSGLHNFIQFPESSFPKARRPNLRCLCLWCLFLRISYRTKWYRSDTKGPARYGLDTSG